VTPFGPPDPAAVVDPAAGPLNPGGHDPALADPFDGVTVSRNPLRTAWSLLDRATADKRLPVSDGTRSGMIIGIVSVVAFGLAAATLLLSDLRLGSRNAYPPGNAGGPGVGGATVAAALVISGVLFGVCVWHKDAANTEAPSTFIGRYLERYVVLAVGAANLLIGLSLIGACAQIRTASGVFAELPSLIRPPSSSDRTLLALGIISCVSTLTFFVLAIPSRAVSRLASTLLAGLPSFVCATAFVVASSEPGEVGGWALRRIEDDAGSVASLVLASDSSRIAAAPILVMLSLSYAAIAMLVTLGIAEYVNAKVEVTNFVLSRLRPSSRWVWVIVAAVAAYFVAGRFGWMPDSWESLSIFGTSAVDGWVLAAVLGGGALHIVSSSSRTPLTRVGITGVTAIAAISIVAGTVMLSLCSLLANLFGNIGGTGLSIAGFIGDTIAPWSLWLQDWAAIGVAILLGVWGLWGILRGERSDRVVFALGFFAVALPLRLQVVLEDRNLWSFSAPTPDQIALAVIALVGLAFATRRTLADDATLVRIVVIVFLVALSGGLVPDDWTLNTFQSLLVAPFLYRFLLDAADLKDRPHRGHVLLAAVGLLFVANAAAVTLGLLNGDNYHSSEQYAFFLLAVPLLVVALCRTGPPAKVVLTRQRSAVVGSGSNRWRAGIAATGALVVVAVLTLSVVGLPGPYERGQYRVDAFFLREPTLTVTQEIASPSAERIMITDVLSFTIDARYGLTTAGDPGSGECPTSIAVAGASGSRSVGPIAGIEAIEVDVGQGLSAYCAFETDDNSTRGIIVIALAGGLDDRLREIIDGISFSFEDGL